MFRSSSDHPQGFYIIEAYVKHRRIIGHIKLVGLLIIRLCHCRLRTICHVNMIIFPVDIIMYHVI